jgi:PAS domain S-box-containing protein
MGGSLLPNCARQEFHVVTPRAPERSRSTASETANGEGFFTERDCRSVRRFGLATARWRCVVEVRVGVLFFIVEFQSKRGAFLEEQSELAEKILDQVADAVICTNHSGTIIRWNHASTALFGHPAEEALGQSVELIIPEHLRAAHWSGFEAAMIKGVTKLRGRPTLTRALHKSGHKLYVEMSFAIVKGDTESEVLGAVAVARDVTERVERERAASRS